MLLKIVAHMSQSRVIISSTAQAVFVGRLVGATLVESAHVRALTADRSLSERGTLN